VLLSEARRRKREKAQKREIERFLAPAFVIDRGVWLQARSQWIYATRRLGILYQSHPDNHREEIARLEELKAVVSREIPNIADDLRAEDLCPTKFEI
jgi:hypothetical protein